MDIKNKVLNLSSQFTKDLPKADDPIDNIFISGYASVNVPDRAGDVVLSSAWEKGMENYLKNPVILAFHNHDEPVGRMLEYRADPKGLWIKARISASSEDVFNKVKDEVITAFSVSFKVVDAEYKPEIDLFIIKELELLEISVVSIPMNQDALFSLSKAFDSIDECKNFKLQFTPAGESAKGLDNSTVVGGITLKEIGMDPKELEQLLAAAAEKAAKSLLEAQAKEKAIADAKASEEAALQDRINKAVAAVTPSTTGAEKLLAEVEKRLEAQVSTHTKALEGLEASIKEKAEELAAIQKSKMNFSEGKNSEITYAEKEKAVLLSKFSGKSLDQLKFGREILEKASVGGKDPSHQASTTWELEVSLNMEAEVRRKLVVSPLLRSINMGTNVMTLPLNPEAGYGTWVTNAQFGTTNSPGAAQTHQMKEITLNSYKLATTEYLMYEEEEDSLIVLLPIVRDAMVRRIAKSVDLAFLRGAGAGADPVKGLATFDATSAVTATSSGAASIANLRALRKDLGVWGLDPSEVTFIVSTDIYYDLLDDTLFQTMDKVGSQATLLTGQVGMIGNSPVLVSSEFAAKAGGSTSATTNYGAIAVAKANFIAGNQRGLRFDTQDLVETQRKVMVASLRTGMQQLTTNNGQGVSVFRWS